MKKMLSLITLLLLCSYKLTLAELFQPPQVPALSPAGENLIIQFEVGGRSGYNPRPEAPDCRYSGITTALGFDWAMNSPKTAIADWKDIIGDRDARRLAAEHAYTGCTAKKHLHEVIDILTPWEGAIGVFDKIDVARTWAQTARAFPGFEKLRQNAQAALISLVFNRGASMTGDNRREMRAIRAAVPTNNYPEIATQLRLMTRIWRGTDIYNGMLRRRNAEADLVLKP